MDDRISELPDDILSYILTMLSIKDLLKTSVLSKRWSKLWGLRKDLYFDINNVLGSEKELLQTGHLIDVSPTYKRVNLDLSLKEFVKQVDQFLKNFPGTSIDSFSVNFFLDCEQSNTIDQWITFAIAREVKKINLLFLGNPHGSYPTTHDNDYNFDFALFSETNAPTIKHLRLQSCIVCYPTDRDFIPFKHLRSLSLKKVKVDEIFIESLLSNCRLLEELCLDGCEFKSLIPKIASSSLYHLKVLGCYMLMLYYQNARRFINLMLVDCPKLNSLECWGSDVSTLNIYAHVLKRMDLSISIEEFSDAFALFATFPELEILRLEIFYITNATMVTTFLKISQPLNYLKQLDCVIILGLIEDCDLMAILNIILQASPLLQKLSVTIEWSRLFEEQKDIRDVEVLSHDQLKVVEFGGCVGNWFEIEFVMNVLKYIHKLDQIVVNPYWNSSDHESYSMQFHIGRERMIEKLQAEGVVGREKLVFI